MLKTQPSRNFLKNLTKKVFFKDLKQTLQLADFMGYNENAVRWQI